MLLDSHARLMQRYGELLADRVANDADVPPRDELMYPAGLPLSLDSTS